MLTHKQKIGSIGENIAVKYLKKMGFEIIERNYRKKWGEIDIIAEKSIEKNLLKRIFKQNKVLHFIEVKSVMYEPTKIGYQPEENVNLWKQKRLLRTIQTYLMERKVSDETDWQIDVMAVFVDLERKKAKIRMTEDVKF